MLIVSGNEKAVDSLSALLYDEHPETVDTASSAAEALQMLRDRNYDSIIINSPLRDETGEKFAVTVINESHAQVMFIVRSELEQQYESSLGTKGAFIVAKPLNRTVFIKGLHFMQAAAARICSMQSENVRLQRKLDEGKIIDRAKGILIKYLSMTEPQAHRYLEKQAMDLRLTKLEVAKNLLSTYDS